jgi:hypothetical protein
MFNAPMAASVNPSRTGNRARIWLEEVARIAANIPARSVTTTQWVAWCSTFVRCFVLPTLRVRVYCLPLKQPLLFLVCAALVAWGCHGSSRPSLRPAPAPSTPLPLLDVDSSSVTSTVHTGPLSPDATAGSTVPTAPASAPGALDSVSNDAPAFGAADVVFHVVNDTGGDVFINDGQPLLLEVRGEPVQLDPGCGSECPSCACKECPLEPARVRRIANRGSWDQAWNRRVYVSQRCGGVCPCTRETDAKPGTYTATVLGKRGATPQRHGTSRVYEGRLDEHSAGCEAKATFGVARGARVELRLTCSH